MCGFFFVHRKGISTVTVSTINSVAEFVTNGVTKSFPFYFKFLERKDLVVTYISPEGTSSDLVMGTHYTVAGAGNENGGSVLTVSALAGPGQLIVSRDMEAYQQTSLRNQGKFLAETHEDVFDRLTMLIQQGFSIFKRALTRPFGREFFFAESRRIASVADPVELQDAATKHSVEVYVGQVLATGQGPANNAANVLYVDGDQNTRSLQHATLRQFSSFASMTARTGDFDGQLACLKSYWPGLGFGGGLFIWDSSQVAINNYGTKAKGWLRIIDGPVKTSWFGAHGDNTIHPIGAVGPTIQYPSRWMNGSYSPLGPTPSPSARPFTAADSTDTVAFQLAIWAAVDSGASAVEADRPKYLFTNSVVMMIGEALDIFGYGMRSTEVRHTYASSTSSINNRSYAVAAEQQYCSFLYYRGDGEPKVIRDMKVMGIENYLPGNNFRGIQCVNLNGFYPRNLWFTSMDYGMQFDVSCSDCHVGFIVGEYCFKDIVNIVDAASDVRFMNGGNYWASQTSTRANGINSPLAPVKANGLRLQGFSGSGIIGGPNSQVADIEINPASGCFTQLKLGASSIVSSLRIPPVSSVDALVVLGSNSKLSDSSISCTSVHPCLDLQGASAGQNKQTSVNNTTLSNTNTDPSACAVRDQITGVSITGGSTGAVMRDVQFMGAGARVLGCAGADIDDTNFFETKANTIQSPDGFFGRKVGGVAIGSGNTLLATVLQSVDSGYIVEAFVSGAMAGIGSVTLHRRFAVTYSGATPTVVSLASEKNGNPTVVAALDVVAVASGAHILIQITNSNASVFTYAGKFEVLGGNVIRKVIPA